MKDHLFNPDPSPNRPPASFQVLRMKVKSVSADSNPNLVVCNTTNGTSVGAIDYIVQVTSGPAVGTEIYAYQPMGGNKEQYQSKSVSWRELAGGASTIPVLVSGVYTTGGLYHALPIKPATSAISSTSSTLAVGALGTTTGATEIAVINLLEFGATTHILSSYEKPIMATPLGLKLDNGKAVYSIECIGKGGAYQLLSIDSTGQLVWDWGRFGQ